MIPDDYIQDDASLDDFELEQAAYQEYVDWLTRDEARDEARDEVAYQEYVDALLREEALKEAAYDAYVDHLAREEYVPEGIEEIAAELNQEGEAEDSRRSTETAKPPSEQKEVDEDRETEGTDPCRSNP